MRLPTTSEPSTTTIWLIVPVDLNTAAHDPVLLSVSISSDSDAPCIVREPPIQRLPLSAMDSAALRSSALAGAPIAANDACLGDSSNASRPRQHFTARGYTGKRIVLLDNSDVRSLPYRRPITTCASQSTAGPLLALLKNHLP